MHAASISLLVVNSNLYGPGVANLPTSDPSLQANSAGNFRLSESADGSGNSAQKVSQCNDAVLPNPCFLALREIGVHSLECAATSATGSNAAAVAHDPLTCRCPAGDNNVQYVLRHQDLLTKLDQDGQYNPTAECIQVDAAAFTGGTDAVSDATTANKLMQACYYQDEQYSTIKIFEDHSVSPWHSRETQMELAWGLKVGQGIRMCTQKCAVGQHVVATRDPLHSYESVWGTYCEFCASGKYMAIPSFQQCTPQTDNTDFPFGIPFCTLEKVAADCLPCQANAISASGIWFGGCTLETERGCPALTGISAAATGTDAQRCKLCPQGYYSKDYDLSSGGTPTPRLDCSACVAGKYGASYAGFGDLSEVASCEECPNGYFSNDGDAECEACAAGFANVVNDVGTFIKAEHDEPSDCVACVFAPSNGNVPEYQPSEGETECVACSMTNALVTATSCLNADGSSVCEAGTFLVSDEVGCENCPMGWFSASINVATCTICPIGFRGRDGIDNELAAGGLVKQSSCETCAEGTYSDTPGTTQAPCKLCPAGRYGPNDGANDISDCNLCPDGMYLDQEGQNVVLDCKFCGTGKYAVSGVTGNMLETACSPCVEGRFLPGMGTTAGQGSDPCHACPLGYYQSQTAMGFCLSCDMGAYNDQTGQESCQPCVAGTYRGPNEDAKLACVPCSVGYATALVSAAACTLCSGGQAASTPGLGNCVQCLPGMFRGSQSVAESEYSSNCLECRAGRYAQSLGSSSCVNCGVGLYTTEAGVHVCKSCDKGFFRDALAEEAITEAAVEAAVASGGSAVTSLLGCASCPVGFSTSDSERSASCSECSSGRFSRLAWSTCAQCPTGYYKEGSSAEEEDRTDVCTKCPTGFFVNAKGAQVCSVCEGGTFSAVEGLSSCGICFKGKFRAKVGVLDDKSKHHVACTLCPVGKISARDGSNFCTACAAGMFAKETGQSKCVDCLSGFFSSENEKECSVCEPGKTSTPGSKECVDASIDLLTPSPHVSWRTDPTDPWFPKYESTASNVSAAIVPASILTVDFVVAPGTESLEVWWSTSRIIVPGDTTFEKTIPLNEHQKLTYASVKLVLNNKVSPRESAWRTVYYIQARSLLNTGLATAWSVRNEGWPTVSTCAGGEYLQTHEENDDALPFQTTRSLQCRNCPFGATCMGPVTFRGIAARNTFKRISWNASVFARCIVPKACVGVKDLPNNGGSGAVPPERNIMTKEEESLFSADSSSNSSDLNGTTPGRGLDGCAPFHDQVSRVLHFTTYILYLSRSLTSCSFALPSSFFLLLLLCAIIIYLHHFIFLPLSPFFSLSLSLYNSNPSSVLNVRQVHLHQ
jgi:hypothetical protein